MMNRDEARALIDKVGRMTKHYAQISVTATEEGTTRFSNSGINQNVTVSDVSVSLTLFDGKKEARCSTNVINGNGLEKLVRDTEAILPFVPDGEFEAFRYVQEPGGACAREYVPEPPGKHRTPSRRTFSGISPPNHCRRSVRI